jgi:hypothetical protein
MAMECDDPADIFDQFVRVPICIGDERFMIVLSPTCPDVFSPHPHRVPSVFIDSPFEDPIDSLDQLFS